MLIPVLLGMSIVVFSIIRAIPGDPALTILGEKASPKAIEDLREVLGLNNPWYIQYFDYLKQILTGDLGVSLHSGASITQEIGPYLAATTELTIVSMLFAVIIGVNAGILSAWKQNSWFDYCAMLIALIGVSMPIFWLGLMEQWLFAQELKWLPSVGRDNSRNPVEALTQFYYTFSFLCWQNLFRLPLSRLKNLATQAFSPKGHKSRYVALSLVQTKKHLPCSIGRCLPYVDRAKQIK